MKCIEMEFIVSIMKYNAYQIKAKLLFKQLKH